MNNRTLGLADNPVDNGVIAGSAQTADPEFALVHNFVIDPARSQQIAIGQAIPDFLVEPF